MTQSAKGPAFIPISVATLVPSTSVGVSLYSLDPSDRSMKLFRSSEYPLDAEDIQRLLERGVTKLYVDAAEHRAYQDYLRESLPDFLEREDTPPERRFATLNEVVRDVLAESFAKKNDDKTVEQASSMGRHAVDLICRSDVVASDLCNVLYHDYHTFTHSANVSYYCVMLAKELGCDRAELEQIAQGGLLHDLGKLEISEAILTKPGRLDEVEYAIIKRHPTIGFRRLCERDDLSFGQLMMVYQHHERLDGRGYPVGVKGDEVHPWARICGVVDVYEALTSNRPYRKGLSAEQTFNIMDQNDLSGFEPEVYELWKQIINTASVSC